MDHTSIGAQSVHHPLAHLHDSNITEVQPRSQLPYLVADGRRTQLNCDPYVIRVPFRADLPLTVTPVCTQRVPVYSHARNHSMLWLPPIPPHPPLSDTEIDWPGCGGVGGGGGDGDGDGGVGSGGSGGDGCGGVLRKLRMVNHVTPLPNHITRECMWPNLHISTRIGHEWQRCDVGVRSLVEVQPYRIDIPWPPPDLGLSHDLWRNQFPPPHHPSPPLP